MYFPKLCIQGKGGCEDLPLDFTGEFCKASKILDPQENIDLDINQGSSFFIPFMFSSGHIKEYDRKIEHFLTTYEKRIRNLSVGKFLSSNMALKHILHKSVLYQS